MKRSTWLLRAAIAGSVMGVGSVGALAQDGARRPDWRK